MATSHPLTWMPQKRYKECIPPLRTMAPRSVDDWNQSATRQDGQCWGQKPEDVLLLHLTINLICWHLAFYRYDQEKKVISQSQKSKNRGLILLHLAFVTWFSSVHVIYLNTHYCLLFFRFGFVGLELGTYYFVKFGWTQTSVFQKLQQLSDCVNPTYDQGKAREGRVTTSSLLKQCASCTILSLQKW